MKLEAENDFSDNTEEKTTGYHEIKKKINEAETIAEIKACRAYSRRTSIQGGGGKNQKPCRTDGKALG